MIEIKNASKTFQKNKTTEFRALNNIELEIKDGELLAIIGKSGAGKTTLLHNIACIDSFDEGAFFSINGTDVTTLNDKEKAKLRNKTIGLVFQDFALIPEFNVFENVEIPLVLAKENKKSRKIKVIEALSKVGLEKYTYKDVTNLSGGEKQRVAIARAIVNNPDIILADEPTGALDTKTGEIIFDLLKTLSDNGKTVIIITHDKDIAKKCERVIEISDGKII
ncbi:MAG: ABC transporter ATP-binding protein [Clostridia bacterium]|nr:ABC transporter ATP-binding protein [Clostridia bacterium]